MKKNQMSDITKKYRKIVIFLTIASVLLLFGPMTYYLGAAAVNMAAAGTTTATVAQVSLFSSSLIITGILTLIGLIRKVTFKSSIWVLLIAIYTILGNVMWAVILIGGCQIFDELLISPLLNKYRNLLTINKEIDKRQKGD